MARTASRCFHGSGCAKGFLAEEGKSLCKEVLKTKDCNRPPVQLQTKRLLLRPYTDDDWQTFWRLATEDDIAVFPCPSTTEPGKPDEISHMLASSRIAYMRDRMREGNAFEWAVTQKACGTVVGTAGLTTVRRQLGQGELGFWIGHAYRRQGFAMEACHAVLLFAFQKLNLKRVEARTEQRNVASQKLLIQLGFEQQRNLWVLEPSRFPPHAPSST